MGPKKVAKVEGSEMASVARRCSRARALLSLRQIWDPVQEMLTDRMVSEKDFLEYQRFMCVKVAWEDDTAQGLAPSRKVDITWHTHIF